MRVLVCGGRHYSDRAKMAEVLAQLLPPMPPIELINGCAPGADMLARDWALARGITIQYFPADWGKHGRAAGPIRNQQMLDQGKPDLVVAFAGGRGTADMVRRARAAGVRVHEVA